MKAKKTFLAALLTIVFGCVTSYSQPQWKFHIAYEDATGAKDTMWFIWDESATFFGIDTLLGEGNVQFDYDVFNVWALTWGIYPEFDTTKVIAIPYNEYFEVIVHAFNFELPIKIRWDTSLFHASFLPPEPVGWVNYAKMESDYFFLAGNDPGNHNFDMTIIDSVICPDPSITDPWFWNPAIHFPCCIMIHQDPNTEIETNTVEKSQIILYPNPSRHFLKIKSAKKLNRIWISDISGAIVYQNHLCTNNYSIDISFLGNGIYYIFLINSQNQYYHEKFIKID
ncbi:MAG: T9SS type A sorting domain-containing protein [Bacteroidales bacterium]